jgi:hypothetical protein
MELVKDMWNFPAKENANLVTFLHSAFLADRDPLILLSDKKWAA